MQTTIQQRFLRIDQLAERFGVSASSIKRMIERGEFPRAMKLGRLSRWPLETIEKWEQQRLQEA